MKVERVVKNMASLFSFVVVGFIVLVVGGIALMTWRSPSVKQLEVPESTPTVPQKLVPIFYLRTTEGGEVLKLNSLENIPEKTRPYFFDEEEGALVRMDFDRSPAEENMLVLAIHNVCSAASDVEVKLLTPRAIPSNWDRNKFCEWDNLYHTTEGNVYFFNTEDGVWVVSQENFSLKQLLEYQPAEWREAGWQEIYHPDTLGRSSLQRDKLLVAENFPLEPMDKISVDRLKSLVRRNNWVGLLMPEGDAKGYGYINGQPDFQISISGKPWYAWVIKKAGGEKNVVWWTHLFFAYSAAGYDTPYTVGRITAINYKDVAGFPHHKIF